MNIKNTLELAKSALKELVAQTQGKFFAVKHDHFSMQDARSAIRRLDEALEYLEKQYPFGVYGSDDLNAAWKSGYDNCKEQCQWVGLTHEEKLELWLKTESERADRYASGFVNAEVDRYAFADAVEAKLKEKNT